MRSDFKSWLEQRRGYGGTAISSRQSNLKRIEDAYGDLDTHYENDRLEPLMSSLNYSTDDKRRGRPNPTKLHIDGDTYNGLATLRSALNLYREFRDDISGIEVVESILDRTPLESVDDVASTQRFGLERDMQSALRRSIDRLEAGLMIVDNGAERIVSSGKIDITARDASGTAVVIELKAGIASPSAIGQILSYMGDVSDEETSQMVRGILVASDFDKRTKAAARVIPNLTLCRYSIDFTFSEVGSLSVDGL